MTHNFQRKTNKTVCECCGHVFYAENGIVFCPECEEHWNED